MVKVQIEQLRKDLSRSLLKCLKGVDKGDFLENSRKFEGEGFDGFDRFHVRVFVVGGQSLMVYVLSDITLREYFHLKIEYKKLGNGKGFWFLRRYFCKDNGVHSFDSTVVKKLTSDEIGAFLNIDDEDLFLSKVLDVCNNMEKSWVV